MSVFKRKMTINNNYFTTTKKYANFLNGPIGEKSVLAIPAIGKISASRLSQLGFEKAYHVSYCSKFTLTRKIKVLALNMIKIGYAEEILREAGVRNHRAICETMREYQRQFI